MSTDGRMDGHTDGTMDGRPPGRRPVSRRSGFRRPAHAALTRGGSAAATLLMGLSLLMIGSVRPAAAQSVSGTAVATPGGDPIEGAFVGLLDPAGGTVASTLSGREGSFSLGRVEPGDYRLRVARTDFGAWTSGPFRVGEEEPVTRRLELPVRPERAEALRARVRQRCEERDPAPGETGAGGDEAADAVLFGQVRDGEAGLPVPDAYVFWGVPDGGRASRFETGPSGAFLLCGLPRGGTVELQASAQGRVGPPVRLTITDRRLLVRDLMLPRETLAAAPGSDSAATATLRGRVRSAETGAAVSGARVTVLETDDERTTGADGTFVIPGLPRTPLRVVTERVGTASDTVWVHLGQGNVTVALLTLETDPVELPGLTVEVERTLQNPRLTGYYERLDRKVGQFITRDDLREKDLIFSFRSLMGVDVRQCGGPPFRANCWVLEMGRGSSIGAGQCRPVIYLDGRRLLGENPFERLESYPRYLLEGIEVYRGLGGAPGQYRSLDAACGVVLAWTRGRR